MSVRTAITPTRAEDFSEWYQAVVKEGELAENSMVRGCMVIKPWGFGVWERIQRELDDRIKATGHDNAYFPLFIPLSLLQREAEHVEGFAKECAVVTHHRLEMVNGELVPAGKLEEPLVVRPTSETIIGESFAKWIQSYRDLPLLINQWANVVRWEMRTRLFLRTTEFLWQEGHTAHATAEEANQEVDQMLNVYADLMRNVLAIPGYAGEKPAYERFPGAERSVTIEVMMQDGKALQICTSHYLGQNFAKACNIKFLDKEGVLQHAYTTSWGASTRMIGGLIMTHSDDDGLRLPPRCAPQQVVILPVIPKDELRDSVIAGCQKIAATLRASSYHGSPLAVKVDVRDIRGGDKSWQWIKKGIPIRIEIGPRDLDGGTVVLYRRDKGPKEKQIIPVDRVAELLPTILDEIHDTYLRQAEEYQIKNTRTDLKTYEELTEYFSETKNPGFVLAKFRDCPEVEAKLADLKVSVRCIPVQQSGTSGNCILTGHPTSVDAIISRAY